MLISHQMEYPANSKHGAYECFNGSVETLSSWDDMRWDRMSWVSLVPPLTAFIQMETHEHEKRRQCDPPHATSQSWLKKWKSSAYNSELFHGELQMLMLVPALPTAERCDNLILVIGSTRRHHLSWRREKRRRKGMEIGEEEKLSVFLFTTDVR